MSLIKKIDVPKHFAARRAMRVAAAQQARLPDATLVSEIYPAAATANAAEFTKDFTLEHSSSSGPATPIAEIPNSDRRHLPA